jgi:hypothetical protein
MLDYGTVNSEIIASLKYTVKRFYFRKKSGMLSIIVHESPKYNSVFSADLVLTKAIGSDSKIYISLFS